MYIEESFDTIFNMGYGGPTGSPPPMPYASGKSPMLLRVKYLIPLLLIMLEEVGGGIGKYFSLFL